MSEVVSHQGSLQLGSLHPIVTTSFEAALAGPAVLGGATRDLARQVLEDLASAAGVAGKLMAVLPSDSGVRLVFSTATSAKLRDGEWNIPIDRTGLPRAEARDHLGRIRETAKTTDAGNLAADVARNLVMIAHVISSMDTARQLGEMNETLESIVRFIDADRRGELRGLYVTLQKAFADTDPARRIRSLESCSQALDALQARFLEAAWVQLRGIRDPSKLSWTQAMIADENKVEAKLRKDLGLAMDDLRMHDFCFLLNAVVHVELGQEAALHVHRRAIAISYGELRELAVEKAAYLDRSLSVGLARKCDSFTSAANGGMLDE